MTIRAVIIGAILGIALAAVGYACDWALKLPWIASDLLPFGPYGLLMVGLLIINPLLGLARMKLAKGEIATIFALLLVCAVIPGPGLMWQFSEAVVMPMSFERTMVGWRATKDHGRLLDYCPPIMLANDGQGFGEDTGDQAERVVKGYADGLGSWQKHIAPSDVPWSGWTRTLSFYMPLILLGFIATVGLALVVHRQWAYREYLKYPLAQATSELISGQADGKSLFRNGLFWWGFAFAGFVLLLRGLATYWPARFVAVPTQLDGLWLPLYSRYPILDSVEDAWRMFTPNFYFAIVGLAFLLAAEVSFTLGISHWVYALVFLTLADMGVSMDYHYMSGGIKPYSLFGSYVGAAMVILYTGRNFYWAVLKRALGMSARQEVEPSAVWGARLALGAGAAMVVILRVTIGLDWLLGILLVLLVGLIFVIITRVNCETGILYIQPIWQPVGVLLGLFGVSALGPKALIVLAMLSVVLTIDPRVTLMPLVVNALRVTDAQKVSPGRMGTTMLVVLALALLVAVPATLYLQYDLGPAGQYSYARVFAAAPFDMLQRSVDSLVARDALATAGQASGWGGLERLTVMQPSATFLVAAGVGLVLILLASAARLRWSWWPIHPVLFLVWGTIGSTRIAWSYLIGWFAKAVITKYGGGNGYRKARAFFIGLIAGEVTLAIFWIAVGAIWFAIYGRPPVGISFHP